MEPKAILVLLGLIVLAILSGCITSESRTKDTKASEILSKTYEGKKILVINTRIPSGSFNAWMSPYILIGLIKVTEEQGEWSAQTALRILDGTKPSDIPVVTNKKGVIYVNLKIADKLGVIIKPELLKNAQIIR